MGRKKSREKETPESTVVKIGIKVARKQQAGHNVLTMNKKVLGVQNPFSKGFWPPEAKVKTFPCFSRNT
jgi:hypothetical protein